MFVSRAGGAWRGLGGRTIAASLWPA